MLRKKHRFRDDAAPLYLGGEPSEDLGCRATHATQSDQFVRCVREYAERDYSHRKHWILERIAFLVSMLAIDVAAYAVTSTTIIWSCTSIERATGVPLALAPLAPATDPVDLNLLRHDAPDGRHGPGA